MQDYEMSPDRLVAKMIGFNIDVELGQLLALGTILIAMGFLRRCDRFMRHAYTAKVVMLTCSFMLIGYQLAGYFTV